MITIKIGDVEGRWGEVGPDWINQQITRRKEDRGSVCVLVTILERDVNMTLASYYCQSIGSGTWTPPPTEQRVSDLWEKCSLRKPDFSSGNLIAFLNQFERQF